jgi:hypothetical protein
VVVRWEWIEVLLLWWHLLMKGPKNQHSRGFFSFVHISSE